MDRFDRFEEFRGRYRGPIVLLGNGPSLNLVHRPWLPTFAGSRYFLWKDGFLPDFYLVTEEGQTAEWQERGFAQARAGIAKFWVGWQPAPSGWIEVPRPSSLSHHHYTLPETRLSTFDGECFHIHMAHDTPLAMLQVARFMGFTEFYLAGVDQTAIGYAWDSEERRKVGDRFSTMAPLYRKAKAEVGGKLWDTTRGGRLNEVLGYRDLEEMPK